MPANWRPGRGELVSATSAVLLLVTMFALAWFGVDGIPGRTARLVYAENAWEGLTLVRWLLLVTIAVALGVPLLHFSQRSHGVRTETGLLVTLLGTVTSVTLIFRVLIVLPSSDQVVDQKLGAFLGTLCALGVAYGGLESLRDERLSASAPPAGRRTPEPPGSPAAVAIGSGVQGPQDARRTESPTTGPQ
jgi:hypothetical protein